MIERIRRLVEKNSPFLIVKYGVTFVGITSNNYDLVTMYGDKLNYTSMERRDVMRVLREFSLPLLHDEGIHAKIWGDNRFRERFKKGGYRI